MFYKTNKTILSLKTIINGNANIICYDSKDVVPPYLRSISQNDNSILSHLRVPMVEHDNLMDVSNQRESIEFDRSISI